MAKLNGKTLEVDPREFVELVVNNIGFAVPKRASMLMAYALNSVNDEDECNLSLPGFLQFVEAPENLTDTQKAKFREDYKHWVVGNGFRELTEGLETYLNYLFPTLVKVEHHIHGKKQKKADASIRKFEFKGLSEKLNWLTDEFGFETGMEKYLASLNQARNCLTHRGGIVGEKDCGSENYFDLRWLGIDCSVEEEGGRQFEITIDTQGQYKPETDAQATFTYVERSERFVRGQRLTINPRFLQEMCLMCSFVAAKLSELSINWFIDAGIPLNNRQYVEPPTADIILVATKAGDIDTLE